MQQKELSLNLGTAIDVLRPVTILFKRCKQMEAHIASEGGEKILTLVINGTPASHTAEQVAHPT